MEASQAALVYMIEGAKIVNQKNGVHRFIWVTHVENLLIFWHHLKSKQFLHVHIIYTTYRIPFTFTSSSSTNLYKLPFGPNASQRSTVRFSFTTCLGGNPLRKLGVPNVPARQKPRAWNRSTEIWATWIDFFLRTYFFLRKLSISHRSPKTCWLENDFPFEMVSFQVTC